MVRSYYGLARLNGEAVGVLANDCMIIGAMTMILDET